MVSQRIPRGGRDVWGILKEAREISTTETMCKNKPTVQTTRKTLAKSKSSWLREGVSQTYLAHGNVSLVTINVLVAASVAALHHDNTGALTLNTSIKNRRQEISLCPPLIKAAWCSNQSPIGQSPTFTGLPIVAWQNKQDSRSRFEDKYWLKGQAVFEQPGTKPQVDIHLHIFTSPHEA